jgi:transposase InsO family protein/transposase-like protein
MKHTEQFKLAVVQHYLGGRGGGFKKVADHYGLSAALLRSWVARYQLHSHAGLAAQRGGHYTPEFKLSVLQHMWDNGLSYRQTAAVFNLPNSSRIGEWDRRYQSGGPGNLGRRTRRSNGDESPNNKTDTRGACRGRPHARRALEGAGMAADGERLLKKVEGLGRREVSSSEKTQIVRELREKFPLAQLLKLTGLSRSTFYYRQAAQLAPDKYQVVKDQIKVVFHRHKGRYGYRRICAAVRHAGHVINHKTVQRLMGELGLKSLVRPKKYQSYKGDGHRTAPNVLARCFKAERPNQKWVTDVTEFNVAGEKLYLSPVMDLHNGEIIAYETSSRPNFELVSNMLRKALSRLRRGDSPVLHSDQGWHYQMQSYQKILRDRQLEQSMSRKGNCLDNAAMESFFAVLKSEFFYLNKFMSVEQLKKGLAKYIRYYNHDRIKMKLGGLSPVQYRTRPSLP